MRKWMIIALLTLWSSVSLAVVVPANNIVLKNGTPTGVMIKNNKVTLQSGYKFEKVSKSRVNVMGKMRGGGTGITGSFDCTCNGTDGGCSVITTGSSVSCAKSTCNSSCYMIVTIPAAPAVMH